MGGKIRRKGRKCLTAAALLAAGLLLAACQSRDRPNGGEQRAGGGQQAGEEQWAGGEQRAGGGQRAGGEQQDGEEQRAGGEQQDGEEQRAGSVPGEIRDGVYIEGGGRFTVKADEMLWEVSEVDGDWELRLRQEPSVWISFSESKGVSREMIENFETDFADSYVEAVREGYPDAREVQIRLVNEQMAGLHLTMTDPSGRYQMYQVLYLVTDGADGWLITSTLSEDEEKQFRPVVEAVIESFEFQD